VPVDPRPFLKWAGGKRQLLPSLRRFYPDEITRYFEPFLGSGAVFFDLWRSGHLAARSAWLSDVNADLIGCYLQVRDAPDDVIAALDDLAAGHERGGRAHYYDVRDQRFNPARARWREAGGTAAHYTPALAAMLIYLNRTGYNGLFRQNASGDLNVPAGRYPKPRIVDSSLLHAVSAVLNHPQVHLVHAPFERAVAEAGAGDFVYFDPPYAPLTATANFRAYTATGFDAADQERLAALAAELATRGTHVLLSNSSVAEMLALYEGDRGRRAGLRAWLVPARRAINSRAAARGTVEELLVASVPPRDDGGPIKPAR
jgi:DNA adenine methylase